MVEGRRLDTLLGLPTDRPAHVLALGAHADDLEIGCGGTVARLLGERPETRVTWVVLSASGARAAEARAGAASVLGERPDARIVLLEGRDGYLPYDPITVKEAVMGLKAEGEPDLVLAHRREDLHQDHRFAAELAWQAFRHALILEFEVPKYEGDLGQPNLYVTLERAACEAKVAGLLANVPSQHDHDWFSAESFWALLRLRGLECHSPSGYAEAFTCRKLRA
ncbi:MAG: PIG-L deacetylase family protein [Candidatus Limnocylindrales bacterium]